MSSAASNRSMHCPDSRNRSTARGSIATSTTASRRKVTEFWLVARGAPSACNTIHVHNPSIFTLVVISYSKYKSPMKSYTNGKNVTREELTRQSHISTHAIMMTRQQKRLSELTESIFTKWKWQLNMNGGF
ncbi:MAG: hypothetical protein VX811_11170, partial [Pseudomonadota bacterium]|nr:hypothetical protein [Pseudomonadota bacterium]